jgi:hypothetical protein
MADAKETTTPDAPVDEQTPVSDAVPTEDAPPALDALAQAVADHDAAMANLAAKGLLTDSGPTNLSLRG